MSWRRVACGRGGTTGDRLGPGAGPSGPTPHVRRVCKVGRTLEVVLLATGVAPHRQWFPQPRASTACSAGLACSPGFARQHQGGSGAGGLRHGGRASPTHDKVHAARTQQDTKLPSRSRRLRSPAVSGMPFRVVIVERGARTPRTLRQRPAPSIWPDPGRSSAPAGTPAPAAARQTPTSHRRD